ncbi:MAG: tripartite tricarboxylate transporter permease [Clostridia bacterium]
MLGMLITGFTSVLTIKIMLLLVLGVGVGIIFGAIPGLSASMAVALVLPVTFGMEPIEGISMLIALYIGGVSGGLISAILLKIPGTPSSIATCFDGHPMAANGEAGKALGAGIVFSFLGGLFSIILLMFIAPSLAAITIKFGPYEYFSIAIFSLTMIASLSKGSLSKGLASGIVGMLIAIIGASPIDGTPRYTFGNYNMITGFNLLPVLIGLFAVAEILKSAEDNVDVSTGEIRDYTIKGFGFTMKEFVSQQWNALRSAVLGTGIGILPGIGGGTSNIIAYIVAKNQSKYPEKFGTGIIDGIVASETANNATIGGALVPLLTLGIPGDGVTAILLGALMIHDITPGPLLFTTQGEVVYGIFAALLISNVIMLIMEFFGMRLFVRLLTIPKKFLLSIIIALSAVGAFGVNNRIYDIWSLLIFGVLAYVMEKFDYPTAPVILGVILGPIAEVNLRRGLMLSQGSFMPFLTKPISITFLVLAVVSAYIVSRPKVKKVKVD